MKKIIMDKNSLISKGLLAHAMGRRDELLQIMRNILAIPTPLSSIEEELLCDAYRDMCEYYKESILKLFKFYARNKYIINTRQRRLIRSYYRKIRNDLVKTSEEIIDVLDCYLIPAAVINMNNESITLFLCMKGIGYTYLTEFTFEPPVKESWTVEIETAYEQAYHTAVNNLQAVNLRRLCLILNYCSFINNIQLDPPRACLLAREELHKVELEHLAGAEISYAAAKIIQDIQSNLSISHRIGMRMILSQYEDEGSSSDDS